jgi:acetoin utilization deacetylase AcuC-like enzyme
VATGLVWDERFAWFNAAGPSRRFGVFYQALGPYDTRESKERIRELLVLSGINEHLVAIEPRLATEEQLARCHTAAYIDRVRALSEGDGGDSGSGAYLGSNGYEIARLAAGGCMEALDAVLAGRLDNAYALVRPAGHHATREAGRGFCVFANVAVAIRHAQARGAVRRVAVVDWDVHHGNGTQDAFYRDPSVLTISIHQAGLFPADSGWLEENGEGLGRGFNINVPLPAGSGHGAYVEALRRVALPALHAFRPDAIVVASGLDANAMDPLARMMCHSGTYREMAGLLKAAAIELCGGRLVACHEGGYSPGYVPWCALAILETLADVKTSYEDPGLGWISGWPYQELQPHQAAAIERAAALVPHVSA